MAAMTDMTEAEAIVEALTAATAARAREARLWKQIRHSYTPHIPSALRIARSMFSLLGLFGVMVGFCMVVSSVFVAYIINYLIDYCQERGQRFLPSFASFLSDGLE